MKLQYKDLSLKTKRALSGNFFKDNGINYDNIKVDTLLSLNTILSRNITHDRKLAFFEMFISETTLEKNLILRFDKYLATQPHTKDFYRLKFGDIIGKIKYEEMKSIRAKGNTLLGHIAKFGKEEGTKLYKERNLKRAHTLDNFIRLYGETKGKEMYDSTMTKKGGSMLNKLINKYGVVDGEIRFQHWKDTCLSSEENFVKRHGEKLGKQKWQEFKEKSKSTKENFIKRHGEAEGTKRYKQYCDRSANTKENFIRVHGQEEGTKRWNNYKNSNAGYKASKQSLDFFKPITKYLINRGINMDDLWFGGDDSFEFKIEKDSELYSYDYTILSKKIIIEFNGNHVHPSKELLGDGWDNWRCAWSGETADEKHSQDMKKIKVAENAGFTVIEIWDFKDVDESLNQCIGLIEERI